MKKVLIALDDNVYERLKQNGKITKQVREALSKYLEANNNNSNTNSNEVKESDSTGLNANTEGNVIDTDTEI